ncbi:LytTR family DNA-binding domain-containing protein [Actibacterium lipolyticum]|uniref:LytTr DNA-binding domain protein n=1 Tax=Actibacterium lipolyticum TaxID=1524263 RepID=A0A238KPT1_9RHOB|nr:LytTR family DNA-binding domain-containing protein [Actibacterium lipolyticum]SMX44036.1 LytTr DNA-binding domain protein [Actibacterium lipolyticum]
MASLKKEFFEAMKSPALYVAWLVVSGMVAYAGPFGTYDGFPLTKRLIYWPTVVAVGIVLGIAVRLSVQRLITGGGFWPVVVVSSGCMGVCFAVPLTAFTRFMASGTTAHVPSLLEMSFLVFVAGIGVGAIRLLLSTPSPRQKPEAEAEEKEKVVRPRLLDRIEPGLQGEVLKCEVFDHYVALTTEKGQARLLMRFSDAIAELDGVDGLQVHRSHWVATNAIESQSVESGRLFLTLKDGSRVPVSRNYRPVVEERGLF